MTEIELSQPDKLKELSIRSTETITYKIEELRKGAKRPKGNSDFISKNRRKI